MALTYDQALKDWEKLWSIGEANDMTGGYVDSEDLYVLLKSPTKTTARNCLMRQIEYWFQTGIEPDHGGNAGDMRAVERAIETDPEVRDIAERYGYA